MPDVRDRTTDTAPALAAETRKATWFELYFDLAFVVAVAALTGRHVSDYTIGGAAEFALHFLVIWSLWVSHTFWASRYDEDRIDQHIFGFTKILAILAIAFGSTAHDPNGIFFASGVGAFKLLLALAYLRDSIRRRDGAAARTSVLLLSLQGIAWFATLLLPEAARLPAWTLLLAIELLSPLLLARQEDQRLPHPEHMPERFGLFTIILLGEAVASALHALTHAETLTRQTLIVSLSGASLSFLFWVGYFHRARSAAARRTDHLWTVRSVRLWVYAHLPLYLGIAGFSTGTVALAGHGHASVEVAVLQAVAVALAMTGLNCVGLASPNNLFAIDTAWRHFLVAASTAASALLILISSISVFMVSLVFLALAQLLLALWTGWQMKPVR